MRSRAGFLEFAHPRRRPNMRCQQCGREIRNAEMWRLTDRNATPTPRNMRTLCRQCREAPVESASRARGGILLEASEIVARYQSAQGA
jgi:hypothetical protein